MVTEIDRTKYESTVAEMMKTVFCINSAAARNYFLAEGRFVYVSRGEIVVREGEPVKELMFLLSGVVRGFLNAPGGKEITDCFIWSPGEPVMGSGPLTSPSLISMKTLSDCEMFGIPVTAVLNSVRKWPELYHSALSFEVRSFVRNWEQKVLLSHSSAEQRFDWLEKHYPGLLDKVPNVYVASFIGVSPVTLSRMKSRAKKEAEALRLALEEKEHLPAQQ